MIERSVTAAAWPPCQMASVCKMLQQICTAMNPCSTSHIIFAGQQALLLHVADFQSRGCTQSAVDSQLLAAQQVEAEGH
jgi:hypothetical protein